MSDSKLVGVTAITTVIITLVIHIEGCNRQSGNEKFKASFCQAVENAYNKGDVNALDEYLSADFVRHDPPNPDIKGLEVFKQAIEASRNNSPDRHLTINSMIMEGDQSASRWTYEATDASTGKKIKITGSSMYRWVNGKAVECWHFADYLGYRQQLGYKLFPPVSNNTFAFVSKAQVKPEKMEYFLKIENETSVPFLKSQKSFRGFYIMCDKKTGKVCGITIWDNEKEVATVMQSEEAVRKMKAYDEKTKDFFIIKPVRERYTVTVQE